MDAKGKSKQWAPAAGRIRWTTQIFCSGRWTEIFNVNWNSSNIIEAQWQLPWQKGIYNLNILYIWDIEPFVRNHRKCRRQKQQQPASQLAILAEHRQTGGGSAESPLFRHEFDGGDMLQSIEHNGAVCFCAYGTATNTHRPIDSVEYVCVCVWRQRHICRRIHHCHPIWIWTMNVVSAWKLFRNSTSNFFLQFFCFQLVHKICFCWLCPWY